MSLSNGIRLAVFFGYMVFVHLSSLILLLLLKPPYILAGSGKTVLLYVPQLLHLSCMLRVFARSSIIEEVLNKCQMGLATIAFFYFDFRDRGKQEARHLLSSTLIQLCDQSDKFSEILSTLYTDHRRGTRQPSEDMLIKCLESILRLPGQGELYLIIDALDECPNSSGYPTPREQVLVVIKTLINLRLPHVHFCITSRPEIDIRAVLEPLAICNVSLHEQVGQNRDIVDYINHFVHSDHSDSRLCWWREEDKQLVIDTLTRKSGGM